MKKIMTAFLMLLVLSMSVSALNIKNGGNVFAIAPVPRDNGGSHSSMGSGTWNCDPTVTEQGANSLFDGRHNVPAYRVGSPCPEANTEFVAVLNDARLMNHPFNSGRESAAHQAIAYWNSWELEDQTHVSFREREQHIRTLGVRYW